MLFAELICIAIEEWSAAKHNIALSLSLSRLCTNDEVMRVKAQWIILGCLILLVNKEECSQASCKHISTTIFQARSIVSRFRLFHDHHYIYSVCCVSLSSAILQYWLVRTMLKSQKGEKEQREGCSMALSQRRAQKAPLSSLTQINYGETISRLANLLLLWALPPHQKDGPEWHNKMKRIKFRVNQYYDFGGEGRRFSSVWNKQEDERERTLTRWAWNDWMIEKSHSHASETI